MPHAARAARNTPPPPPPAPPPPPPRTWRVAAFTSLARSSASPDGSNSVERRHRRLHQPAVVAERGRLLRQQVLLQEVEGCVGITGKGRRHVANLCSVAEPCNFHSRDKSAQEPPMHPTRPAATAIGFVAVLLRSLLAVFTAASGAMPPLSVDRHHLRHWRLGRCRAVDRAPRRGQGPPRQPWPVWLLGVGGLFGYHAAYFIALRNAPSSKPVCSIICGRC